MSRAKDFFDEFAKFAPQHTSIAFPLTLGLISFSIICIVGYTYNERKLKNKYYNTSPLKEPEKVARLLMTLMIGIFVAYGITDFSYTIIDFSKNKKWYVWKYKWFPNMLA